MFTGIVQGKAHIVSIAEKEKLNTLEVQFPKGSLKNIARGASIALNGCCLTVTTFQEEQASANFDVMQESLRATNLGALSTGDDVNFERAAKIGDEIGGHQMSGHVSQAIQLIERHESDTNCELVFACPAELKKYILPKGYIGINGCSLTIGAEVTDRFSVHLIPETLSVTTFGRMQVGETVNIEIDPSTQAIVDTVESYLATKA